VEQEEIFEKSYQSLRIMGDYRYVTLIENMSQKELTQAVREAAERKKDGRGNIGGSG